MEMGWDASEINTNIPFQDNNLSVRPSIKISRAPLCEIRYIIKCYVARVPFRWKEITETLDNDFNR